MLSSLLARDEIWENQYLIWRFYFVGKNASHQSLFSPESSSNVGKATTEAGVDRALIDKLSDQGKKLKLIATGEFHGILGGGNDDFLLQFSYIFSYSKNVWLETYVLYSRRQVSNKTSSKNPRNIFDLT
jgi:hypothetical protein